MASADLSIAGPGSPISMQKFTDYLDAETPIERQPELIVMLNQSGQGLLQDNDSIVQVMIADRVMQAHYWRDEFWNGKQISAYLYRYVYYMLEEDEYDIAKHKYPNNQAIVDALTSGALTETSDEFVRMKGYFEWLKSNNEVTHIVGLVQLVGGSLRAAAKKQSYLRIFIEEPETGMHPKRERKLVTLIKMLGDDYGFSQKNHDRDVDEVRKIIGE